MMGNREIKKGGDEYDCFSKKARRILHKPKYGGWKKIKRQFWQRVRSALKRKLKKQEDA